MNNLEIEDVRRGARMVAKQYGYIRLLEGVNQLIEDHNSLLNTLLTIENRTLVIDNGESLRLKVRDLAANAVISVTATAGTNAT